MTVKHRKDVPYMVTMVYFASLEAREKYLQTGEVNTDSRSIFFGRTERWAAVRFARACIYMHTDPLIQGVMLYRNFELVAWVSSGVPPKWDVPELAF